MRRRTNHCLSSAALLTVSAVFASTSWPARAQDAEWVPFVVVAPAVAHGAPAKDDIAGIVELLTVRLAESAHCAVSDARALKLALSETAGGLASVGAGSVAGPLAVDVFVECSAIRQPDGLTVMAKLRPADGSPLRGALAFVSEGQSTTGVVEPLAVELLAQIEAHGRCIRAEADARRAQMEQRLRSLAQGLPRGTLALRFAEHFDRDMALKAGTADVAVTKVFAEAGQAVVAVETADAPEAAGKVWVDGEAQCRVVGRAAGRIVARATCSLRLQPADPNLAAVEAVASSTAAAAGSVAAGHAALDAAGEACALRLLGDYLRVQTAASTATGNGGAVP